jgi:hypothetical protein
MSDRRTGQSLRPLEDHGQKSAHDALHHNELARAIVDHIANMPPGSVIAVQGAWGRGKTDVVTRVCDKFEQFAESGAPMPIWLDPWQYGRPDLIQPVVLELLRRSPADKQERIKAIARTLLHASNAMAFKAVSVVVPFGSIIDPAKDDVDTLIDRALGAGAARPDVDVDPVKKMAERFRDLVKDVLIESSGKPLLVCVDDLDRCLPDHQIAMLEAIHFLTSARANCTFLVAIDPFLVQQAALAHYHTNRIDTNQYLDKLFQLRINLTSLLPQQIGALIDAKLDEKIDEKIAKILRDGLHVEPDAVRSAFSDVFNVPELANPRLVHRTFERLRLAAAANIRRDDAALRGKGVLVPLVAWCAVAERWPQLRQLLQATGNDPARWYANINVICGYYDRWLGPWENRGEAEKAERLAGAASIIDRLPGRLQQPDLGQFLYDQLRQLPGRRDPLELFQKIDAALIPLGL